MDLSETIKALNEFNNPGLATFAFVMLLVVVLGILAIVITLKGKY